MAGDQLIPLGFLDPIDIESSGRPRSVKVKGVSAKVNGEKINGFLNIEESQTQGAVLRLGQVFLVEVSGEEWPVVVNSFNLKVKTDDLTGTIGFRSDNEEDPDDADQQQLPLEED